MIRPCLLLALAALLAAADATAGQPAAGASASAAQRSGWSPGRLFLGATVEDAGGLDQAPVAKVGRVFPGSSAERLGLQAGDLVVAVNGSAVDSAEGFRAATAGLKPGDALRLEVRREGRTLALTGTAEAPPRPREVVSDAERLRAEVAGLRADGERERMRSSLEESLRLLQEIQAGLPAAAAEFKRLYPQGTFSIQFSVDIRSDPVAPVQEALRPARSATSASAAQPR